MTYMSCHFLKDLFLGFLPLKMKWGAYESSSGLKTAHLGLIYFYLYKALAAVPGYLRLIERRHRYVSQLLHLIALLICRDTRHSPAVLQLTAHSLALARSLCPSSPTPSQDFSLLLYLPTWFSFCSRLCAWVIQALGLVEASSEHLLPTPLGVGRTMCQILETPYISTQKGDTHTFCYLSSPRANTWSKERQQILPCAQPDLTDEWVCMNLLVYLSLTILIC